MRIDKDQCIACGECVPYCSMKAINVDDYAVIDQDECVDCGVCLQAGVCPVDCIIFEPAPWPRSLRAALSNPRIEHKETRLAGRGTEEMKTNDVTGLFPRSRIGLGCEFGRPIIGTRFHDVDKVARMLAKHNVEFAEKNPVTMLMEDKKTGKMREDVLNEKVLSAILECVFPIEKLKEILNDLKEVANDVDTVFSVEVINRADPDGSYPAFKILDDMGIKHGINGKQNAGLGRPYANV